MAEIEAGNSGSKKFDDIIQGFRDLPIQARDRIIRNIHKKVLNKYAKPRMASAAPEGFADKIDVDKDNKTTKNYVPNNETAMTIGFTSKKGDRGFVLRFLVYGTEQRQTKSYKGKKLDKPSDKGQAPVTEGQVVDAITGAADDVMKHTIDEYRELLDKHFKKQLKGAKSR